MQKYDVAAYVWPAYTGDEPRTRIFWPEGIGEWQTVRSAGPKFPGHLWPRKPLWGYVNEADPYVMEMQINAALDHGVNTFIYDWYWYEDRPFLEQCLDNGFLKARNNSKMKFFINWANHDANHIWCKQLASQMCGEVIWNGFVSRAVFEKIAHRWIEQYFAQPNYYTIGGKPLFMIHDALNFVKGMGGIEQARSAVEWFRAEAVRSGFPGLELLMCTGAPTGEWDPFAEQTFTRQKLITELGFDGATTYGFLDVTYMDRDYMEVLEDVKQVRSDYFDTFPVPYYPNVAVGWDTSPRHETKVGQVCRNNTPDNFECALRDAKEYVASHNLPAPLITLNSWNEWTETSYLQPDDLYGYRYLQAVKRVFCE